MLVRYYNVQALQFRDFVQEIGANPLHIRDTIAQNTTAREAGIWALAVYHYIESTYARYAYRLRHDLMHTSVNFIRADDPIAQKYGWYRQHFHDLAIVYADSPYILIILSNRGYGGGLHITNQRTSTHTLFEEISGFMQDFNTRYFGRSHIIRRD
jgi:hypothetical protein